MLGPWIIFLLEGINMRHTYDIIAEPHDGALAELITFCADRSKEVLLVVREKDWLTDSARRFLSEVSPWLISQEQSSEWPGTCLISATASISKFSITPHFMSILREHVTRLYQWQQPDLPEDLCFIRQDGTPLLVTITHEHDAYMELEEDEYRDFNRLVPSVCLAEHQEICDGNSENNGGEKETVDQ